MILVGLTGGIACGKSTVARLFANLGARVIDADRLVHQALTPGGAAFRSVVEAFPGILDAEGRIDRARLGRVVFDDPDRRRQLEAILHPLVFREQEARTREYAREDPSAVVVFDAALLIESGAQQRMDQVIVVHADRNTQLARLRERDGLSPAEAEKRIRAQMDLEGKKCHADYLIDGGKTLPEVERRVREIFTELKSRA